MLGHCCLLSSCSDFLLAAASGNSSIYGKPVFMKPYSRDLQTKISPQIFEKNIRDDVQFEFQTDLLYTRMSENVSNRASIIESTAGILLHSPAGFPEADIWKIQNSEVSETNLLEPICYIAKSSSTNLSRRVHDHSYKLYSATSPIVSIRNFTYSILCHVYSTITTPPPLVLFISCIWLYLTGSLFFDVVHYLLHQCFKSRHRLLRRVGYLHQMHHLYFNRNLKFNDKYHWQNICVELPLELSCQLFGTWLGWVIADYLRVTDSKLLSRDLFILVLWFEVVRVFVVALLGGQDSNHKSFTTPPKDTSWLLVGPEYHALHHIDPAACISSTFRLFDWILGTVSSLQSRRITITGASGAFGSAIKPHLEKEGVKCIQELEFGINWTYDDYEATVPVLANTDVLILAHGAKENHALEANCESLIKLIELFKKHHKPRPDQKMLLPEVWYVGNETELHTSWSFPSLEKNSRSFLPHAETLYDDPSILYRHIVISAPMVSLDWVARVTLWWIRRGARYVPIVYTGMPYLNYFKFLNWAKKA